MKNTIITISVLSTFVLTLLFVAWVDTLLFPDSYRLALQSEFTVNTMFIIGWLPALVVGIDLRDMLIKKSEPDDYYSHPVENRFKVVHGNKKDEVVRLDG
jgi:hypothetical protein